MSYIELENVSFNWPRGERVLAGINLEIEKQETLALVGANGSGKTTLARLILGLLQPSRGQVMLEGKPVGDYTLAARGRKVGYVLQNPEQQFFAQDSAEEIGFALRYRGYTPEQIEVRVAEMLKLFELEDYAATFPFHLSQGEKQRLALAAVMAPGPDFLILDEPITGLDWLRKKRLGTILERVRAEGIGFLLICHDREFGLGLADRQLTLEGGRLV